MSAVMGSAEASLDDVVRSLARLIARTRLSLSTEKAMQADVEAMLASADMVFQREFRLSDADIPDFLVDSRVVVECKLRGARKVHIFRQLERYALDDSVQALVLVSNVSMGLPAHINGKPAYQCSISRAWL